MRISDWSSDVCSSDLTLFVHAMVHLPLETATAIGFVSPLYVTALSIPFLGEKVGIRRWAAVGAGFVGVMIILRPGTDVFQPADRKSVVSGKGVAVRVDLGGCCIIKTKK